MIVPARPRPAKPRVITPPPDEWRPRHSGDRRMQAILYALAGIIHNQPVKYKRSGQR
jgi:hypothetical protein